MVRDSEPSVESKDPLRARRRNQPSREFLVMRFRDDNSLTQFRLHLGIEGSFDSVAVRYRARRLRSG